MAIKYTLVHLGFHFEILATKKFHVVVEFFRAIGAVASAGALHAQGRGFKSLIAHHICSCGSFFYPLLFARGPARCVAYAGIFLARIFETYSCARIMEKISTSCV